MKPRRVQIIDTSLRDGLQAAGVTLSFEQRRQLAEALVAAGVDELEAGTPISSSAEAAFIKSLGELGLPVICWCRARLEDLEAALACDTGHVHLALPVSPVLMRVMDLDEEATLKRLIDLSARARTAGARLTIGAMDVARSEAEFLCRFADTARACGAARLRLADTVGLQTPLEVAETVTRLKRLSPPLEYHAHNDLGLATANALTALQAGAAAVDVTVGGLGERAGNAALEEVAAALSLRPELSCDIEVAGLPGLCQLMASLSGEAISPRKPVSGSRIGWCESGVHAAGLLKDPASFQPWRPSHGELGQVKLVAGSSSGAHGVRAMLAAAGIEIDQAEASNLALSARLAALSRRGSLAVDELIELYQKPAGERS